METFSLFNEAVAKTTLQYHKVLNPKLWQEDKKLDPTVRAKLLEIARVWQKFANIDNKNIIDIILTGGNANYNYTRQSDLDVHLIIDYRKVAVPLEFVQDYFFAKKAIWAANHSSIRVKNYPVELFAEDKSAKPRVGHGVYSLLKGKWVIEPVFTKINFSKDALLAQKVEFYINQIDDMVNGKQSIQSANILMDKLYTMRAAAIQLHGEFSFENLVFKDLRNRGYIGKLSTYLRSDKEKQLSLR